MPEIDNLLGSTRRVVEEQEPLNNCRGVTYRVINVDGGGGSSAKVVSKTDSMPVASSDNADMVYLFDGESTATYTHGYIYENVATTTSSSASATQTVGSGLSDIAVDLETLESFTGWTTDNSLQIFYTDDGWSVDATSLGITYTGTPSVGDAITISYTAPVTTYAWVRIDVQPAPEALPDQTGQSGKFLTTNGSTASWGSVESLPSQTGQSGKFLTTDGTDASWGTLNALQNKAAASTSFSLDSMPSNKVDCTMLGIYSSAGGSAWVVSGGTACGYSASVGDSCTCIGASTQAGAAGYSSSKYNIAIGKNARAAIVNNVVCAIQIGAPATGAINNDSNTLKVANANGNFEIMSADGTIPAARHASLPAADGTYVLKLTISGGVPTLAWVAE